MSEFSPTHWVIFAVIVAALLWAVVHVIMSVVRMRDYWRERAEKKKAAKPPT